MDIKKAEEQKMIRDAVVNKILDALNFDIFRITDFNISRTEYADNEEIRIQYGKEYYNIKIYKSGKSCRVTYSPGKIFNEEESSFLLSEYEDKLREDIRDWELRLKYDLTNPLLRSISSEQLDRFKEELDKKLNEVDDSYFSKEEGEELKQKLEELKENFVKANKETEEELNKLRSEIDFLKTTVDTLSKKKWLRNAATKIWAWSQKKENQELIKTSAKAIKAISQIDISEIE